MTTTGVDVVPAPEERRPRMPPAGDDPERDVARRALRCAQQVLASVAQAVQDLPDGNGHQAGREVHRTGTGAGGDARGGSRNGHERWLTGQERRVLTLLAAGFTNREIAHVLEISDKTAKNYVHILLVKLDVSSRTEAAFTALYDRLVDQDECRRARDLRWPPANGGTRRRGSRTP